MAHPRDGWQGQSSAKNGQHNLGGSIQPHAKARFHSSFADGGKVDTPPPLPVPKGTPVISGGFADLLKKRQRDMDAMERGEAPATQAKGDDDNKKADGGRIRRFDDGGEVTATDPFKSNDSAGAGDAWSARQAYEDKQKPDDSAYPKPAYADDAAGAPDYGSAKADTTPAATPAPAEDNSGAPPPPAAVAGAAAGVAAAKDVAKKTGKPPPTILPQQGKYASQMQNSVNAGVAAGKTAREKFSGDNTDANDRKAKAATPAAGEEGSDLNPAPLKRGFAWLKGLGSGPGSEVTDPKGSGVAKALSGLGESISKATAKVGKGLEQKYGKKGD